MTADGARPLRFLLIYDRIYPESLGGVEHRNRGLALALAERGHHTTLAGFCRDLTGSPGVDVLALGEPSETYTAERRTAGEALRLARACARLDVASYDLVECANIPYAHIFPLAWRCRRHGTPLMVTWYEYWGSYFRHYLGTRLWWVYAAVEALAARLGSRAVPVSRLTARRLARRRRGADEDLIPCGLTIAKVRAAAGRGSAGGAPLIYAGRLLPEKRVELLLRAVALIKDELDGPLLTVIGDGPQRDELHGIADSLGLEGRVRWLGYLETNDAVWEHLAGARVAVQPSSREGFGLFPIEAMAVGLPVVCCESPENAVVELVRDGETGFCTRPEPAALADALRRLLRDEALHRRLGRNASRFAEDYDWPRVAERFERLAREMLTCHR